jgi:lipopolysaccharide/colanic/teichoic acid biosynthesis glycosyltransferase
MIFYTNSNFSDILAFEFLVIFNLILNDKLSPKWYQEKLIYISSPYIYSFFIQLAVWFFFFLLDIYSQKLIHGLLVTFLLELILIVLLRNYLFSKVNSNNRNIKFSQELLNFNESDPLFIENKLFVDRFRTFQNIDLNLIQRRESNRYFVFDLDLINNWYNINERFLYYYNKIENGGFLSVRIKTREQHLNELGLGYFFKLKRFKVILIHDFLAKIPFFDFLINRITLGKRKLISDIEFKGRCYYNGFNFLFSITHGNEKICFLQKSRTICENPNPSFYLITKLNRVSINGQIIKIAKVRSMYPYSEFLQKDIYESNQLDSTGKFNNDPRITFYGKFIRKYWIDELPQLFELMSGKIKLVGIRAMSEHFFSLYSEEYRKLYYKVKPGIISPIFDENCSFEEIEQIEKKYLEEYNNSPLYTDVKYFLITLSSIIKGTRSK